MKHAIKIASMAALAALSGAFVGTVRAAAPAVDATFFVSGASASRKVPPAIAAAYCSDSPVLYKDSSSSGANYNGVICTFQNAAPVPAALRAKKVAVWTRAQGGSLFGVIPIAVPAAIDFLDPASCPADDGNPATSQVCPSLVARTPDVGISDEDGEFTCAASQGQCSPAVLNGLKSLNYQQSELFAVVWTLQAGLNVPFNNISSTAASGIFAGSYTRIDQVQEAMGLPVTSTANLKVCRRTNTSGTQAGHRYLWTGISYCGERTPLGFVGDGGNINGGATGYSVINNESSGNLESCMTDVATNGPSRSIGINSLENSPGPGAQFKNLSINGIAPTMENAIRGIYPYYSETTGQFNTSTQVNNAFSTAAQKQAFANFFITQASIPSVISAAGIIGVMGSPITNTPTNPPDLANPVAWHSKFLGFGGNNCRAPQPIFPN